MQLFYFYIFVTSIKTKKKSRFLYRLSVSINLSTRWQTAKKEVIFCQFEIVGVRWYGRVQIGKKQVTARKFDVSLAVFIGLSKSPNPTINLYIFKITCGRTTFSTARKSHCVAFFLFLYCKKINFVIK